MISLTAAVILWANLCFATPSPETDFNRSYAEVETGETVPAPEPGSPSEAGASGEVKRSEAPIANSVPNAIPDAKAEIRVNFDNDVFIKNAAGGDRGYTNGVRFSALWPMSIQPPDLFGRWRKRDEENFLPWLLKLLDENGVPARPFVGVALGQAMFTPLDLSEADVIRDDRPYAGWLYIGGIFSLRGPLIRFDAELDVGTTGRNSFAEQSQKFIHQLTNSTDPKGWDNQISGGVGINFYLKGQSKIFNVEFPHRTGVPVQLFDGQFYAEMSGGTFYNSQAVGIYTRTGWIKQAWLRPDRSNHPEPDRKIPARFDELGTDMFQIYIFSRIQSEFVLYNATIQGLPWTDNKHTLAINPLVHEGEAGVVMQPVNSVELLFSATHRTQETRGGHYDKGGHTYGHIQIGFFWY